MAHTIEISMHHFSMSMPSSRQGICSNNVRPGTPSNDGPMPVGRKVTPNTNSVEREDLTLDEVVNMISQIFRSNKWSSEIKSINVDFADSDPNTGQTSVGVSTVIRVTLANGLFHEGIGYGHIIGCDNGCTKYIAVSFVEKTCPRR